MKHLYSMTVGILLMQWIFGSDWIHSFISSLVTYILCLIFPRKYLGVGVFIWAMTFMTFCHIYRMYISYMSGIFDFTGTQMVLTMKLTSFAYNLYDGTADRQKVFHDSEKFEGSKAKVYKIRKQYAIESLPNPLEFFGYIFCFTCLLAGPAFEYQDYAKSIDGKIFEKQTHKGHHGHQSHPHPHQHPSHKPTKEPSSVFAGFQCLVVGIFFMVTHLILVAKFPFPIIGNKGWIEAHPNHVERFLYTIAAAFTERTKFYFAWKVAEAASVFAGFGFQGYDDSDKIIGWHGVENVDIIGVETACNIQNSTRCWNKRTQGWLERYTYSRTGNSLVITYFVSALWHGLYPGFFFFFMFMPVLTTIERGWRTHINPLILPGYDGRNYASAPSGIRDVYWILCTIGTYLTISTVVQTFSLGSWENCHNALGSYYYGPYIFWVVLAGILSIIPAPRKPKATTKKTD
jgi:hypothetical protein